jgi:hypothetical protein
MTQCSEIQKGNFKTDLSSDTSDDNSKSSNMKHLDLEEGRNAGT